MSFAKHQIVCPSELRLWYKHVQCQWILHTRVYAGIAEDGGGSTGIVVAVTFGPSNSNSSEAVPEQILWVR